MRLGVCVYILREGQLLLSRPSSTAEAQILQVPTVFIDGEVPQTVASRLVREATGQSPEIVSPGGLIAIRQPNRVDTNISVWVCRDPRITPSASSNGKVLWLPTEPEVSPEIPSLDRQYLSFILQRSRFRAEVTYLANGQVDHIRVRKDPPDPPPQE